MEIRNAAPDDAEAICAIYNEGIEGRQATFETRPRRTREVVAWFDAGMPLVVAVEDGSVIGFARVNRYSERAAYAGVGEHAVYVEPGARRRGSAASCSRRWRRPPRHAGYYKLTSRVFTTNDGEPRGAPCGGFYEVGVQPRHGRLDGEWKDCILVERLLGDAAEPA